MWFVVQLIFGSAIGSLFSILFATGEIQQESYLKRSHSIQNSLPFTPEELRAIEQFRPMVSDVLERNYENSSQFLIPWIRVSNFNLELAEKKLRETQQWKKDINWDELEEIQLPPFLKRDLFNFDGVDKDGNQLVYVQLDDIRKSLTHGHRHNLTRYFLSLNAHLLKLLSELSEKTGKENIGGFVIADGKNYNIKQHACYSCISFYTETLTTYETHFPELIKYIVGVNSPSIFKPLVEVVKPFMSEATQKGLHIFGFDKKKYIPFLLSHISKNQLRVQYGGNRTK